jgi:glycosyltransferase involved in cell wall biosynthesis/phospholipid N-methyltransferase
MTMSDINERVQSIKSQLENMINNLQLEDAKKFIQQFKDVLPQDKDIISFEIVINILEGNLNRAEELAIRSLQENPLNIDIIYNLGYIKELNGEFQEAYDLYKDCISLSNEKDEELEQAIKRIKAKGIFLKETKRIAFFHKKGLDNFLGDIIKGLSTEYRTKKIEVTNFEQIDVAMKWADICWFEWCDELIIYGSRLKKNIHKKIICRLHSYEAFTPYINQVNWTNVDKIVFVSQHIKDYVLDQEKSIDAEKAVVIANGVKVENYIFRNRCKGYKIAYVGYINAKKGPMLLLHAFKALFDTDNRYKLYIAGEFQDSRYVLYFKQMIKEMGLENNIFFDGWQENVDSWLEDKNYIISTSVLESQHLSIMEAMAKGIKPIIHNFVGARTIYDDKYIWNTISEFISKIQDDQYDSREYREFVSSRYSYKNQIEHIKELINNINTEKLFDYDSYWNNRLDQKFDIEGVGYIGLGKTYNKYLYQSRIEVLSFIETKIFTSLRDKTVLEIGPGIGIFTEKFYKRNPSKYIGIDISKKSVEVLSEQYKNFQFIRGDIANKDIYPKNMKFDLIFGADVLLHLTDEKKYIQTIKNLSRSLNDHGYLILIDPITIIGTKSESSHVVIRELEYVKNILAKEGLELVANLPTTFFMNFPFDYPLLGVENGKKALEIFNNISQYFSQTIVDEEKQELFARYLYLLDKLCLSNYGFGLSQKALIIRKIGLPNTFDINISDIWKKDLLIEELKEIVNKFTISISIHNDKELLKILNCIHNTFLKETTSIFE